MASVHVAGCKWCLRRHSSKEEALKCCTTKRTSNKIGYIVAYGLIILGAVLFIAGLFA